MSAHQQKLWFALLLAALLAGCQHSKNPEERFTVSWTNNVLTLRHPQLRGGPIEVWYLEAFCRSNAHHQKWDKTTIPHRTKLLKASEDGTSLEFLTLVQPAVEVRHSVQTRGDRIDFIFEFENKSSEFSKIQWFQPACVRVARFTGADQNGFITNCFVFTAEGKTGLHQMDRTTNALYLGGQVFLPAYTRKEDANPRPLAGKPISSGLIGCTSFDGQRVLTISSSATHELFEGVYTCIHSDPYVGGLKAGEKRRISSQLLLLPNEASIIGTVARKSSLTR